MTANAAPTHRVSRAVAGMRATCSDLTSVAMWSMSGPEATDTLVELGRLEAQIAVLKTQTLARVEQAEVHHDTGATSTTNWLAHHTKLTRREAARQVRLTKSLEKYEQTRDALAQGRLHVEQAEVITKALDDLPDDLADAHEAALLEREERDAAAASRLTITEDGHGRVHGRFTLDALHGAMFKKALLAFAAPKHRAAKGPLGDRRPSPERMGQAFAEFIERYPANKLPKAGGLNATVVVLLDYESLIGGLKAAQLDTGEKISASLARRLACEAGIIPAVLNGKSQVLDLGRTRRFHSEAQRIAKLIEQGGRCIVENCDAPAGLAHMHHPILWSQGGRTDRDGWLICPPHHARAHDPTFTTAKLPTGKVAFSRRT